MYLKLNNGQIKQYPYSISKLKAENPQVSFPSEISNELLAEFDVYPVEPTEQPTFGLDMNVQEQDPELVNGQWKQTWLITQASSEEHLARILEARANEYPPMTDYLDGIVKGDQAQVQAYIDACLAVKAKYPKP